MKRTAFTNCWKAGQGLTIVIPALNEAHAIGATLDALQDEPRLAGARGGIYLYYYIWPEKSHGNPGSD